MVFGSSLCREPPTHVFFGARGVHVVVGRTYPQPVAELGKIVGGAAL